MKKHLIIWLSAILFAACQKESIHTSNFDPNHDQLMSLSTSDARKSSFNDLLTPEEKLSFLKARLETVSSELMLGPEQTAVLDDLKRYIKSDLYIVGSQTRNEFLKYEPTWRTKARKVLSKEQIGYIFSFKSMSEFKKSMAKSKIETSTRALAEDCNCSTHSEYCSGDCKVKPCSFSNYGCGTLFLYECDGLCS